MANERWEAVRREMNVDEAEVLAIRRLMQADTKLAEAHPDTSGHPTLVELLDAAQRDPTQRVDLYLGTLTRYVATRGGHIEIRAVLPDGPVTVLRLGDGASDARPS